MNTSHIRSIPSIIMACFALLATGNIGAAAPSTSPATQPTTQRARLGISISDESKAGAGGKQMIENFGGNLLVQTVRQGSLAERMGFQPGDVIVRINAKEMKTVPEVLEAVRTASSLHVDILRNQQPMTLSDGEEGL